MDLNATPFRLFLKVAELKSFTRAADALRVSQPALSASIKELERQLGFKLFERSSRRVTLTQDGRTLLVNARRVVLETDWMQQRARDIRTNDLRVGVQYYSALVSERTALTDGFQRDHPKISMRVLTYDHSRLYESVRSGESDIVLAIEPSERNELSPINPNSGAEFETLALAYKPLRLLVPEGHPLAQAEQVSSSDLRGHAVTTINRFHGGAMGSAVMRHLLDWNVELIRPPEGDILSVVRYAGVHGVPAVDLGWFLLPRPIGSPRMHSVSLESSERFSTLVAVRHRREQRAAAALFWSYCRKDLAAKAAN